MKTTLSPAQDISVTPHMNISKIQKKIYRAVVLERFGAYRQEIDPLSTPLETFSNPSNTSSSPPLHLPFKQSYDIPQEYAPISAPSGTNPLCRDKSKCPTIHFPCIYYPTLQAGKLCSCAARGFCAL